jgi:spermidine synthase
LNCGALQITRAEAPASQPVPQTGDAGAGPRQAQQQKKSFAAVNGVFFRGQGHTFLCRFSLTSPGVQSNPLLVHMPSHSRAAVPSAQGTAKGLLGVLLLIGFTAVIAQIVLMRELMVAFYGNEMSLGLMLASWLLWTAIGSGATGRWAARTQSPRGLVALLETLLAAAFPLAVFLVRASKQAFQTIPGEILGPGPMILTSLVVLSFFCLFSGGLFAAGSRLYVEEAGVSKASGTSNVYLLEAAGSGVGGILASVLLIRFLSVFQIAALLSLLNLMAAVSLIVRRKLHQWLILGALAAVFLALIFPFACARLEEASLSRLWSGYRLVASRNSVYGNLAIVQTAGMRSLFENGQVSFNVPDTAAAEEAVHYALLEHPLPKNLLLIGGGLNGSVSQALQYASLERIDYVELDPAVLALARNYFPAAWALLRSDPRVHTYNRDGRRFVKSAARKYDVIIVNLPEPRTAQLNRFYTREFFEEAARDLAPRGIFSFQLKAAEDYISPDLAQFLRCINRTLRQVFPEVKAIPGDTVHFFAATRPGILTLNAQELIARLRVRQLRTSYVREYYVPYRMMPDRMSDLESQIEPRASTRINRDFAPVAYYFDVALWSTQFNHAYRQALEIMARVSFRWPAAVVSLALFALAGLIGWQRAGQRRLQASVGFCVAAMGFTLMGLEIMLLLAFQAVYGYVYQELAVIIAGFMAGMALGSWRASRDAASTGQEPFGSLRDVRAVARLQVLALVSPLLLYLLFVALAGARNPPVLSLASEVLFPVLAVLCGLIGGHQFPIASRIFLAGAEGKETSQPGQAGLGALYALDLAGACLGALLLSAYLVPVFGLLETAALMALVNLAPAALVGFLAAAQKALAA